MARNGNYFILLVTVFCLIEYNTCETVKSFRSGDLTKIFFPQTLSCGGSSRFKKATLKNPSSLVADCKYTIKPFSTRVCQLRIDFDTMLAQPKATTEQNYPKCVDDVLRINDLEICGNNLKQHIYVPFDVKRMSDSISINVRIADRAKNPSLGAAVWSATVRQLECSEKAFLSQFDKLLAPNGCTQFFTEPTGAVESLNYNQGSGPYIGNLSYAICFKRQSALDTLSLKFQSFNMSQAAPNAEGYDTDCVPHIRTQGGSEDHITIPEAVKRNTTDIRATKFCGKSLANSTLIVNAREPFIMYFYSDAQYDGTSSTERGFKLEYTIS